MDLVPFLVTNVLSCVLHPVNHWTFTIENISVLSHCIHFAKVLLVYNLCLFQLPSAISRLRH